MDFALAEGEVDGVDVEDGSVDDAAVGGAGTGAETNEVDGLRPGTEGREPRPPRTEAAPPFEADG